MFRMTFRVAALCRVTLPLLCLGVGCKTFEQQVAPYEDVFETLQVSGGESALGPYIVEDEEGTVAYASAELPFTFDQSWRYLSARIRESTRDQVEIIDKSRGLIVTYFFGINSNSEFSRYYMLLNETAYETTIVHFAATRCARGDGPLLAMAAVTLEEKFEAKGSCGQVELTQEDFGFVGRLMASDGSGSLPRVFDLYAAKKQVVQKVAIARLLKFAEGLNANVPLSQYAGLNRKYANDHILPCELTLDISFNDGGAVVPNGVLDAAEAARLIITIKNQGPGEARGVEVKPEALPPDLTVHALRVGDLRAGGEREIALPVAGSKDLSGGEAILTLRATEERGFASPLYHVNLTTAALVRPVLEFEDVKLGDSTGLHEVSNGSRLAARVLLRNEGSGDARQVRVRLSAKVDGRDLVSDALLPRVEVGARATVELGIDLPRVVRGESLRVELDARDGRGAKIASTKWTGSIPIMKLEPTLRVDRLLYDGDSVSSSGDRNGIVSNGEAVELEVRIFNDGNVDAEEAGLIFDAPTPGLIIKPQVLRFGSIPAQASSKPLWVNLQVARGLDVRGSLDLPLTIIQRDFEESRAAIRLPFRRMQPDLVISPRDLGLIEQNIEEERSLRLTNRGRLAAEDLTVTVRTVGDGGVRLLNSNADGGSVSMTRTRLQPDETLVLPVRLIAPRGDLDDRSVHLRMTASHAGFESVSAEIALKVAQTPPVEVRTSSGRPQARVDHVDKTPPSIILSEPLREREVFETTLDTVEVRGRAVDENGIYRVTVNGNEAHLSADQSFSYRQRLAFGQVTRISIIAMDPEGNMGKEVREVFRTTESTSTRRDRAILFGISRYRFWSDLDNPVRDADVLATSLREQYGFDVEVKRNSSVGEIRNILKEEASAEFGPTDQLLLFFAGHGQEDDQIGDGLLIGSTSDCRQGYDPSCMTYGKLAELIEDIPARRVLVVIDGCFSGVFGERIRGDLQDANEARQAGMPDIEWIERSLERSVRQSLTSGGDSYVGDGSPGGHSPFVEVLLARLRSGAKSGSALTLAEVYSSMKRLEPMPLTRYLGPRKEEERGAQFLFIPISVKKRLEFGR